MVCNCGGVVCLIEMVSSGDFRVQLQELIDHKLLKRSSQSGIDYYRIPFKLEVIRREILQLTPSAAAAGGDAGSDADANA